MKFWDSSALLPLLLRQATTERVAWVLRLDPEMVMWWATPVECTSAFARLLREGSVSQSALRKAQELLDYLRERAYEVQPAEEVRARAERLLTTHRLRAADALQLAAALEWCEEQPRSIDFVCLDDRLRLAALLEGFRTLPYPEEVHDRPLPE